MDLSEVSITIINEDQLSVSDREDIYENYYEENTKNSSSINSNQFRFLIGNEEVIRLGEKSVEHQIVKTSFLSGMGAKKTETEVVAIHKNTVSSTLTKQARLESFRIFSEAVAEKCGGDANIQYAWYGGGESTAQISLILSHGFSRCRGLEPLDHKAYKSRGVGVQLSAAKFSIDSALSATVDESGLQHVLLCRVILGKPELSFPGSKQRHPSSKEFDSGVDNLSEPRKYIVWSSFMNSHILPQYIISFKAAHINGTGYDEVPEKVLIRPSSPWMSFPVLISILAKFLEPSKTTSITKCHSDFLKHRITRPQLVHRVRHIAGDKLLTAIIKQFKNKVQW